MRWKQRWWRLSWWLRCEGDDGTSRAASDGGTVAVDVGGGFSGGDE